MRLLYRKLFGICLQTGRLSMTKLGARPGGAVSHLCRRLPCLCRVLSHLCRMRFFGCKPGVRVEIVSFKNAKPPGFNCWRFALPTRKKRTDDPISGPFPAGRGAKSPSFAGRGWGFRCNANHQFTACFTGSNFSVSGLRLVSCHNATRHVSPVLVSTALIIE